MKSIELRKKEQEELERKRLKEEEKKRKAEERAEAKRVKEEQERIAQEEAKLRAEELQNEEDTAFDLLMKDFHNSRGSVLVNQKGLDGKTRKIGKFGSEDFDPDIIASKYGGGVYSYTLYDENNVKQGTKTVEYANPIVKETSKEDNTTLIQALFQTVKELAVEVKNVKEGNKNFVPSETSTSEMYKMMLENQRETTKQMVEAIKTVNMQPKQEGGMEYFLTMLKTVKELIPQAEKTEKPSFAEALELADLLSERTGNGKEDKKSFTDMITGLLTDGHTIPSIIAMFKGQNKPTIPATQSALPQMQGLQSIPLPVEKQEVKKPEELNPTELMKNVFSKFEENLFGMKMNGDSAEDVANSIIAVSNFDPDLVKVSYLFFKNVDIAYNELLSVSKLFNTDAPFLKEIVKELNQYFYPQENTETKVQE